LSESWKKKSAAVREGSDRLAVVMMPVVVLSPVVSSSLAVDEEGVAAGVGVGAGGAARPAESALVFFWLKKD